MNLPTILAQATPEALREWWPFLLAAAGIIGTWGESRVHISGLREWKKEASAEIAALKRENTVLTGRADLQGQQMTHILSLLEELRKDVKQLLGRKDVA